MKNLGKKGLTQSKAQSISNLCNQLALEIENKINGFNVLTKTLKYDSETLVMQEAKPVRDIENLLSEKAELHGLQAHLMEALKAKNNLMNSISNESFESPLTMPERTIIPRPEMLEDVDVTFGIDKLTASEYAEYLQQEAIASHYGQFVHKGGKLSKLRNTLAKYSPLEWEVIEDGKKHPVKVMAHHTEDELIALHVSLSNIYNKANQRVNYFKAKIKNLTSEENQRIHKENAKKNAVFAGKVDRNNAEYESALQGYNAEVETLNAIFEDDRERRLNAASQLRISVDPIFQDLVDELNTDK
jgi:hypothetical protein